MGELRVLNISDLSSLIESRSASFNTYRTSHCIRNQSWLNCAVDFITWNIVTSDVLLRYQYEYAESLDNFGIFQGVSLTEIRNPVFPFTIINDEIIPPSGEYND